MTSSETNTENTKTTTNVLVGSVLGTIGIALGLVSVARYSWVAWQGTKIEDRHERALHVIILCLWILVPPIWFAIEPSLPHGKNEKKFRKGQDAWSKIWVGVSAMLTLLASVILKTN
jgi:hypothetical protein